MPVPASPFTAVPVPAGRIALSGEIDRPPYSLPPAPVLPEKAARNQSVKSSDVTSNKLELPSAATVPLSKDLPVKDNKDNKVKTSPQKEPSAVLPSKPAVRKPLVAPSVKTPAAAPPSRAQSKEAPAKGAEAKTTVPGPASVLSPTAPKAGLVSGAQDNLLPKLVQQNTELPAVDAPSAQKDKPETVYYSRPGIIEIMLERQGWIYAGEKEGRKGLSFESKENLPGNPGSTLFRFSVRDEGPYKMVFQLQDRSGRSEVSEIDLKKGAAENPQQEDNVPDIENSGLLSLFSTVSEEAGKDGAIEKNEITEKIIKAAVLQASGRIYEKAIEMLEIIPEENPDYAQMDTVYYLLGQYYEADSVKRNASRSVYYYGKLIDEFPLSSHVYDAQSRIKYLEKHFIHIR